MITLSSNDDETHKEKINTPPPVQAKIKKEAPEELETEVSKTEASKEHADVTAELLRNVKIERPDDPEARAIAAATAKTRKHLSVLRRHQANQQKLVKNGPVQGRQRIAGCLNDYMEAVRLPNRGAGLVRKKGRKFKWSTQALDPSKSSDSEEEEEEDKNKSRRKSVRKIPKGAMLKHYHNQKRMYLGKEVQNSSDRDTSNSCLP